MTPPLDRREFVQLAAGFAVAAARPAALARAGLPQAPAPDASERALVLLALDAVRSAGAV